MNKTVKKVIETFFSALGFCLVYFLGIPVLLSIIYNNYIAYNFNLPTFNYWFFFLIMLTYSLITGKIKINTSLKIS